MGARKAVTTGNPVYTYISTTHTERQNPTMRMPEEESPEMLE